MAMHEFRKGNHKFKELTCAGKAAALIARLTSAVVASFSVSAVGICTAVMLTFNTLINV